MRMRRGLGVLVVAVLAFVIYLLMHGIDRGTEGGSDAFAFMAGAAMMTCLVCFFVGCGLLIGGLFAKADSGS